MGAMAVRLCELGGGGGVNRGRIGSAWPGMGAILRAIQPILAGRTAQTAWLCANVSVSYASLAALYFATGAVGYPPLRV